MFQTLPYIVRIKAHIIDLSHKNVKKDILLGWN